MIDPMDTLITTWLKNEIPGFSFNSAAEATGIGFSTLRRHLIDEGKNSSAPETIVTICRAYGLNPVAALVIAGLIEDEDVEEYWDDQLFAEQSSGMSASELFDRLHDELYALQHRVVDRSALPMEGQMSIFDVATSSAPTEVDLDPDYSNMSAEDARNSFDLAAKEADPNIGHDELPHEP